ncbi:hypothetical protein DERP_008298 [Dermatophagoides pteronyssinus]|uniref:Uncharacterized protein n=1 Tax=Dermatophagoides pteronyssinus TaxID=6956 RepID=A0ABQ8J643_DERPT|nr:hypothetical protein DERP_008298 [Dermatophagoides pteronyssinus]
MNNNGNNSLTSSTPTQTPPPPPPSITETSDTSNFFWPSFRENEPRNHHRFARNKNPEFSMNDATTKRDKAREYGQQLEQQIMEKNQKIDDDYRLDHNIDNELDRKLKKEQKEMREEFDNEHPTSATESVYSLMNLSNSQQQQQMDSNLKSPEAKNYRHQRSENFFY